MNQMKKKSYSEFSISERAEFKEDMWRVLERMRLIEETALAKGEDATSQLDALKKAYKKYLEYTDQKHPWELPVFI
jgi:uncharacterized protein YaaN involved in tellurite resistance